jgi:hypothetical protein
MHHTSARWNGCEVCCCCWRGMHPQTAAVRYPLVVCASRGPWALGAWVPHAHCAWRWALHDAGAACLLQIAGGEVDGGSAAGQQLAFQLLVEGVAGSVRGYTYKGGVVRNLLQAAPAPPQVGPPALEREVLHAPSPLPAACATEAVATADTVWWAVTRCSVVASTR